MNGHVVRREGKRAVRWQALYYVDKMHGGPRWKSAGTFALKREAEAALVKTLDAYLAGTYREASSLTMRELYVRWTAVKPEWAANTRRHHKMNFEHHIEDALGDEIAETLPKDVAATWQADLLRAGCAPKSVSSYRGTLHAMYVWGISVDLVTVNPVAAVKPPKFDRADHDALTVLEMRAYLEAVRKTRLWPGLLLGAGGGMRRGEFLAVRWSVFCEGGLTICHRRGNLTGQGKAALRFGPPKTKAGARFVPLPAYVLAELAALKLQRQAKWVLTGLPWDDDALVCCGADGQPIVPDGFTGALWRFRKNHHLPDSFHAHAFRHGVVEAMLAAGERPEVVSAIVGHKHIATTLGIYAHATEAAKRQAGGRYGALWDEPSGEPENGPDSGSRAQLARKSNPADELEQLRQRKRPA